MKMGWAVLGMAAAAGVALGSLGWVIARRLTAPVRGRSFDLTIRGVNTSGEHSIVLLDRTPHTAAPGLYCLLLENGGLVRLASEVEDHGPALVGRELLGAFDDGLRTGARASWSGIYFSSPEDSGVVATDVGIQTDVGIAPAWLVTPRVGSSSTWAIHIHGLGSTRAGTLRGVQVAVDAGFTSLIVSYRNDGEGPSAGSGRSTLGVTELDDVREAIHYALAHGARRFILFGWSMGAAIALQLAAEAEFRATVAGLVLESPVLDWAATIKANCVRSGLPRWSGALAVPWLDRPHFARLTGLGPPVELRRFDWIARADELPTPTLILHGSRDRSAPISASVRLRDLRPDLVTLQTFSADHTMTWNSDPERWRVAVMTMLDVNRGR